MQGISEGYVNTAGEEKRSVSELHMAEREG
jgi:hypothetical protein